MRLTRISLATILFSGLAATVHASPVTYTTTGTLQVVSGADKLGLGGSTFTATNTLDTTQAPISGTSNQYSTNLTVNDPALPLGGSITAPATVTINYSGPNSSANNISVSATSNIIVVTLTVNSVVHVPSIPGLTPSPIATTTLSSQDTITVSDNKGNTTVYSFSNGTIASNPAGANCSVTPTTLSLSFGSSGGSQGLNLSGSTSTCPWSATSDASWIMVSPASGQGSGTISVIATPNIASFSRAGHVSVNGQVVTVTQAAAAQCATTLVPTSLSFDSNGGTKPVGVTTSPSGCAWTAVSSNTSWLTVSPSGGSGDGSVSVIALSNSSTTQRTATVTIGSGTVSVTQAGVNPCTFSVSPSSLSFPSGGGDSPISITASGSGCAWAATSDSPWVTFNPASGSGSASITATASSNASGVNARTANLTVAGQPITASQAAGITCTFTVSPTDLFVSGSGGSSTVTVTPNNVACPWTASTGTPWLAVAPTSATGPGTVSVVAEPNSTGVVRNGSVTVAGQSVSVTQSNVAGCSYIVSPSSIAADSVGGPVTINVTATSSSCNWGFSAPSWITSANNSGSGSGSFQIMVLGNETGVDRVGFLTLGGQAVTINQKFTARIFTDVSPSDYFFNAVNLLASKSITTGCAPGLYCPAMLLSRAQMAVFIVRSLYGGDNFTASSTPYFDDVPTDYFAFQAIQKLKELGITSGCTATSFCPEMTVSRDQAAVLLIRARYGASANPFAPPTPYFVDVPADYWAFSQVQRLKLDRITNGCATNLFCPPSPVTRGDMAIFLMRAIFNQLLPQQIPTITNVSPNVISRGQTQTITITGNQTSFSPGATTLAPIPGVTFGTITVSSPTLMTVSLTVAADALQQPDPIRVISGSEDVVLPNGIVIQ